MAKKLISMWLALTIILFSTVTIFAEENVEGQFLNRNIDINGNRIVNYYLEKPFVLYGGLSYVPLTGEMGEMLGFTVEMDKDSSTLKILKQEPTLANLPGKTLKCNLKNQKAVITNDITVLFLDGEKNFGTELIWIPKLRVDKVDLKEYPLLKSGDIFYLPIRAFGEDSAFRWNAFFDDYSGLYISTEPGVDAKAFFDKKESDYNRGLVNYILSRNKNLSRGWATMLVFLFKHEAEVNGVDELLLMAMANKESTFRADAVGKGAGPVGLMQIMPKTAKAYGISRDQLFDPHVNIEFGSKYIGDKLNQYGNNKTVALSAYNQGGAAISRGSYSTRYATNITGAEKSISQYLVDNGYGLGN